MLFGLEKILRSQCRVASGSRLLVAVSGGADSVALLSLLRKIALGYPLELFVAHLDHGMRPESEEDAAFVRRLCEQWGVPFYGSQCNVPALAREKRLGLEEAAREARKDFLEKTASEHACEGIALGHHRDDQAETVLHRLLRGTALPGLAAMQFRSGMYIRPLLHFGRAEIREYVASEGLMFVEDASNADRRFTRNRIRHELLPVLQTFNPRVADHLVRLAGRIGEEEDFWQQETEKAFRQSGTLVPGGIRFDRRRLLELHPALRMRVFRQALSLLLGTVQGISTRNLQALEDQIVSPNPQSDITGPQGWSCRRYESLWIRREPLCADRLPELLIDGPGVYPLSTGSVLRVFREDTPRGEGPWAVEFDASRVPFPLKVRSWVAGDRFRPSGMEGHKKLKDYFVDKKIPREVRSRIPIVEATEILWLAGLRRCEGFRPVSGGAPVLRLVFEGEECLTNGL